MTDVHAVGSGRYGRPITGLLLLLILVLTVATCSRAQEPPIEGPFDWRSDWALRPGFSLEIDTGGYTLPTDIAFVPNPGPNPEDVLYYVSELRGVIKVVTNNRSVVPFAEVETFTPEAEFPGVGGEGGLASICLDPNTGYVFATHLYKDADSIFRNGIVRFETRPQTFGTTPTGRVAFPELFSSYESRLSHQIGSCRVSGDTLFVSVGDGFNVSNSQDPSVLAGKILRMSLDGEPLPDNPFYDPDAPEAPQGYVWALGFRNPFGLEIVADRLFAVENGPDVDGLREIERGANYLWESTNWSIGSRIDVAFWPPVGPAHLAYLGDGLFPDEYRNTFLIAASGSAENRSLRDPSPAGIIIVPYDLSAGTARRASDYFVRRRGESQQLVPAVAIGPDGVYFAPLLPNQEGMTDVLRISHDPASDHPFVIGQDADDLEALTLMTDKQCFACHQIEGEGGTIGPSLDFPSLRSRLTMKLPSANYRAQVEEVDLITEEPFISYRDARHQVLDASGQNQIRLWIKYRLLEPRFDDPTAKMPNLGLTELEAEVIRDFLVGAGAPADFQTRVINAIRRRQVPLAFAAGFVLAATLAGAAYLISRRRAARGGG